MRETARRISFALIWIVLFSCAKKEVIRPPIPPEGVTSSFLIERISYDRVDTLTATAKIRMFRGDDFSTYFTGVLNYRRPDLFASSLFGPFGVTVMKMLIAEDAIELYLPQKDVLYRANLKVPSLLPDSRTLKALESAVSETDNDYILTFSQNRDNAPVIIARYSFNKETLENHTIEKYNGATALFTIMVEEAGPENIPVKFTVVAGQNRFLVRLENLQVNGEIPQGAFARIEAERILPLQDLIRALDPSR